MRLLSDFMLPDLDGVFFYPYLNPDLQSTVDVQMVRLINDPDSLEAKEQDILRYQQPVGSRSSQIRVLNG